MKSKSILTATAALFLMAAMTLVGCSAEEESSGHGVFETVADSLATAMVEGFIESTQVEAAFAAVTIDDSGATGPIEVELQGVSDIVLVGSKIYAGYDRGVIIYDMADKTTTNLVSGQPIDALVLHQGKVYVGGQQLQTISGVDFEPADMAVKGNVTDLFSFGMYLVVATDQGLYTRSALGDEVLLEEMPISAVTADGSGLWVGTSGRGLYRWDGEDFAKRYLARDSSLFDYVNCLAFNHDHLYVGTDSGLFVFDGGRWKTLTSEDGLPSDYIKDIDATSWVVYVATEAGVTSYFNGDIMPVKKLADREVNSLALLGRKLIVGTDYEGILVKSGPALKTLIDPNDPTAQRGVDIFSVSL